MPAPSPAQTMAERACPPPLTLRGPVSDWTRPAGGRESLQGKQGAGEAAAPPRDPGDSTARGSTRLAGAHTARSALYVSNRGGSARACGEGGDAPARPGGGALTVWACQGWGYAWGGTVQTEVGCAAQFPAPCGLGFWPRLHLAIIFLPRRWRVLPPGLTIFVVPEFSVMTVVLRW